MLFCRILVEARRRWITAASNPRSATQWALEPLLDTCKPLSFVNSLASSTHQTDIATDSKERQLQNIAVQSSSSTESWKSQSPKQMTAYHHDSLLQGKSEPDSVNWDRSANTVQNDEDLWQPLLYSSIRGQFKSRGSTFSGPKAAFPLPQFKNLSRSLNSDSIPYSNFRDDSLYDIGEAVMDRVHSVSSRPLCTSAPQSLSVKQCKEHCNLRQQDAVMQTVYSVSSRLPRSSELLPQPTKQHSST